MLLVLSQAHFFYSGIVRPSVSWCYRLRDDALVVNTCVLPVPALLTIDLGPFPRLPTRTCVNKFASMTLFLEQGFSTFVRHTKVRLFYTDIFHCCLADFADSQSITPSL